MFLKKTKNLYIKTYNNLLLLTFKKFYLFFFIYKNYFILYKYHLYKNFFFSKFLLELNFFIFWKYNLYKFIKSFFFLEFFLDGLYYRVKYYKQYNILGFILGFNHYILYKLPVTVKASIHMKKRKFFLYGLNLNLLTNISNEIVNLKYPNIFKGKGIKILIKNYRKKNLLKKSK